MPASHERPTSACTVINLVHAVRAHYLSSYRDQLQRLHKHMTTPGTQADKSIEFAKELGEAIGRIQSGFRRSVVHSRDGKSVENVLWDLHQVILQHEATRTSLVHWSCFLFYQEHRRQKLLYGA